MVGYGYRLLADDERPLATDELYWTSKNNNSHNEWEKVIPYYDTVEKWKEHHKDSYNIYIRRKIEIPEGFRLLDKNDLNSKTAKYVSFHNEVVSHGKFDKVTFVNLTVWADYCNRNDNIEWEGVAYIEPIKNMNNNTNELEEQLKAAKIAVENAAKLAKELEDKLEKAKAEEIKVGDWVFAMSDLERKNCPKGTVGKVTEVTKDCYKIEQLFNAKMKFYFRKATNEEIEKYLLAQAAKDGWVVGAKVNYNSTYGTIEKLFVTFDGRGSSYGVSSYYEDKKEPFVAVKYNITSEMPIAKLKLEKEDPITIVVDGTTYTAKIENDVAIFGCAQIAEKQIKDSLDFISAANDLCKSGNRKIEAVQIGKGIFTIELLKKLAAKFK